MTKEELTEIIESQGWDVLEFETNSNGERIITFETWSNAGEELCETIWVKPWQSFTDAFFEWADNFDPEEHVKMWANCTTPRVPSLFTLVEDAKDIEKIFWDLADAIRDFELEKSLKEV
jgi:hypothetical protein